MGPGQPVPVEPEHRAGLTEPPVTGGCLCGRVRFELGAAPGAACYCHCTRCQQRTGGAASAQARVDGTRFKIVAGADLVRAYRPRGGFEKCFCGECGSSLFSRDPSEPARMSIRLGAFDSDPGTRPSWRQFVAYAAPWEPIPDDGLPRYPEGNPGPWSAAPG